MCDCPTLDANELPLWRSCHCMPLGRRLLLPSWGSYKELPCALRFLTAREQAYALRSASRKLSTQDFKSWYKEARTVDYSIISVADGSSQWPTEGRRWAESGVGQWVSSSDKRGRLNAPPCELAVSRLLSSLIFAHFLSLLFLFP